MPATISFSPYITTNSEHAFILQTDGFIQGVFLDNPALRYTLEGGQVAQSQSTPIWGGLPLTLSVVAPTALGASSGLGQQATLATAEGNIDGWCVMNQASAGVVTTSSPVPLYPSGASLNFVRAGCGLWVVLPVNPSAVNTIAGGGSNQTIYWNFAQNYVDIAGVTPLGLQIIALNTNSKTINYNGSTGFATYQTGGSVIVLRV